MKLNKYLLYTRYVFIQINVNLCTHITIHRNHTYTHTYGYRGQYVVLGVKDYLEGHGLIILWIAG